MRNKKTKNQAKIIESRQKNQKDNNINKNGQKRKSNLNFS